MFRKFPTYSETTCLFCNFILNFQNRIILVETNFKLLFRVHCPKAPSGYGRRNIKKTVSEETEIDM